jgi:hypothetical protein
MNIKMIPLTNLFTVKTGDFHATSELNSGDIPLVSCGETNNGVIGKFDIPYHLTYERCLTIAYNGKPLLTKFHPYRFGAKDDVGVLIPKNEMRDNTLLYIAAVLSRGTWRYSYGRKCFSNKIPLLKIPVPVGTNLEIDEAGIDDLFPRKISSYIPPKTGGKMSINPLAWKRFPLASLFDFDRGDFNSYQEFPPGKELVVSRSAENNGVAGHYEPPENARRFPKGIITVSTVTGNAFVQLQEFFASDKVVLCIPRIKMHPTTLFFIAFAINHQCWRYSYGRSCFKRTISLASVDLPVRSDGTMHTEAMERIVNQTSYWGTISRRFS